MRLFQRRCLKCLGVIADIAYDLVYTLLHGFYLIFKPVGVQKRYIYVLAQSIHIQLKATYAFHIKCQEQVIVALGRGSVVGIILVVIHPKLSERLGAVHVQRKYIVSKRSEHPRGVQQTLQQI